LVPEGAAERTSTMSLVGVETVAEAETAGVEDGERTGLLPADREALAALPAGSALLVVRRGPNAGSRFLLDADVTTVGRSPDSDIFLDDVTVSRRHAEFARSAQGFLVRDVGSLNGTYVDRNLIQEALLRDGDEVQVGKYRLVFHAG
jgi:pSer/pThr/pTyr-binding forkhead associated (FHA) protein